MLDLILDLLLLIEDTFTSPNPDVEDIKSLFELREEYEQLRRPSVESVVKQNFPGFPRARASKLASILKESDVLEYAAKQLGISG